MENIKKIDNHLNYKNLYENKISKEKSNNEKNFENVLVSIQHYIDFLNFVENNKSHLCKLGFDFDLVDKMLEKKVLYFLDKLSLKIKESEFNISSCSSFYDVINNSSVAMMRLLINRLKSIEDNKIDVLNDEKIKDIVLTLRNKFDYLDYYVNLICTDDKFLEKELNSKEGYLDKYEYFFKVKKINDKEYILYPGGIKKIPFIKFFYELNNNLYNITKESLNELDPENNFLNKNILCEYIRSLKMKKTY